MLTRLAVELPRGIGWVLKALSSFLYLITTQIVISVNSIKKPIAMEPLVESRTIFAIGKKMRDSYAVLLFTSDFVESSQKIKGV